MKSLAILFLLVPAASACDYAAAAFIQPACYQQAFVQSYYAAPIRVQSYYAAPVQAVYQQAFVRQRVVVQQVAVKQKFVAPVQQVRVRSVERRGFLGLRRSVSDTTVTSVGSGAVNVQQIRIRGR